MFLKMNIQLHHEHENELNVQHPHVCEEFDVISWNNRLYHYPQWIHHCPEIYCNPHARPMEVCPNGQLCIKGHLYCNKLHCICGTHHQNKYPVEHLAHCDPYSHHPQYCPNGHTCNPEVLECVQANNIHTYCICPLY